MFYFFSADIHVNFCSLAGWRENNIQVNQAQFTLSSLGYFGQTGEVFHGSFLDTGAQIIVIGERQAHLYSSSSGILFQHCPSKNHISFGDGQARSIGYINILISTPGAVLKLKIDVVKNNIPFLIGLDVLDQRSLQLVHNVGLEALTVEKCLQYVTEGSKSPTVRKLGHIYYEWSMNSNIFI